MLGSAPAALSLRLGAKDRGKGADLARADVAGLAWPRLALPEERGWSAGWRSRQEALGVVRAAWRELLGKHYPAMALVEVSALLEPRAKVEIQALAVLP